jgi:hypothetical protein
MRGGPAMVQIDLLSYVAELVYPGREGTQPRHKAVEDYLPLYKDRRLMVREGANTYTLSGVRSAVAINAIVMMTCTDFHENRSWYIVRHLEWSAGDLV